MNKLLAASVLGVLAGSGSLAQAATISEDLNFSLYGFVDISGAGAPPPITTINGSITVTYDPTLSYDNDTTDLVIHSLTGITSASTLGFTYQNGYLEFGGIQNDADLVSSNTTDFVVAMYVADPTHPTLIPCSTPGYTCGTATGSAATGTGGYTQAGTTSGWFYSSGSILSDEPIPPAGVVPEPADAALLALGLGVLGVAGRRRRG